MVRRRLRRGLPRLKIAGIVSVSVHAEVAILDVLHSPVRLSALLLAMAMLLSLTAVSHAQGVSDGRFAKLARGINFSHWFAQVYDPKGYTPAHFDSYITDADIDLVRDLGFTHVRLSVEPKPMLDWDQPGELKADYVAHLDAAIDKILARNLAVIVDIHAHPDFNTALANEPGRADAFVHFWSKLADHLSGRDPEMVFLEVLNEPIMGPEKWLPLQERAIAAIRAAAPQHTIIATGGLWTGIDDLLRVTPVADRNVVYNFHFYDPGLFTHQGANWGWVTWAHSKGTPYPLTSESIADLLPGIEHEQTRKELEHAGRQVWDARRIDQEMARAAEWAKRHGVRITCNELGVYRQFSDPQDRAEWIRDVREACEKHNIGWAMWDYAGGFSLVSRRDGRPVADPLTVEALGLAGAPK